MPFYGARYRGLFSRHIDWQVYFFGAYAPEELSLIDVCIDVLRARRPGPVVCLDVGANAGHHTLFLASKADSVFAFEPYPPLYETLSGNVSYNSLDNVHTFNFGLGSKNIHLPFSPPSSENEGLGSFAEVKSDTNTLLEVRNGTEFLNAGAVPQIGLIKIDVEGFEAEVVQGLSPRIKADRPILLMEITGPSREMFGDQSGIAKHIYPDARFFGVRTARNRRQFRLEEYAFHKHKEVVILPADLVPHIYPTLGRRRYRPGAGFV